MDGQEVANYWAMWNAYAAWTSAGAAVASFIVVLITAILLYRQVSEARKATQLQGLAQVFSTLVQPEMRAARRQIFAKKLPDVTAMYRPASDGGYIVDEEYWEVHEQIRAVSSPIQTIALLWQKGLVTTDDVAGLFPTSYRCWSLLRDHVATELRMQGRVGDLELFDRFAVEVKAAMNRRNVPKGRKRTPRTIPEQDWTRRL